MHLEIIPQHPDSKNPEYSSSDCQNLISAYQEYYPQIGFNLPWVGYFIKKDDQIVGSCSFTGQPQSGKVEIAYWTFEGFEGQGIASFACEALVNIARNADPALIITAKTAPEHNASTKVLQKNGFVFTEIVQDDEIGDAWLWVLQK